MFKFKNKEYCAEATGDAATPSGGFSSQIDKISALLGEEPAVEQSKPVKPKKESVSTGEVDDKNDENDENEAAGSEESAEGSEESTYTEKTDDNEENSGDEEATWAKALGVDESNVVLDDEGNFSGVVVKIDGKINTVPLKDLIAGYQTNKSNTNKSQALAVERSKLEQDKNAIVQGYTKKLQDVTALTSYLEKAILKDYEGVDFNALRFSNPGEYAAMVQDYQIRTAEIEKIKQAVGEVQQQENVQMSEQQNQMVAAYVQQQVQKVVENNPKWAEPKVLKKALTDMQSFIEEAYGFSSNEFAEIKDARIIEVLKDAMNFRRGSEIAKTKIVKNVPKFIKPTSRTAKPTSKLESLVKKAKQTSGADSLKAQRDAVAELLYGQN